MVSGSALGVEPITARSVRSLGSGPLYLQASVNGNRLSGLYPFLLRGGTLWASPATLKQLGFKPSGAGQDLVRLEAIPGTQVKYDVANQAVAITAPSSQLDQNRTVITTESSVGPKLSYGTGLLLNYDLYGTHSDKQGGQTLSATTGFRAFNRYGVFSNTTLTRMASGADYAYVGQGAGRKFENVRLDTSWVSSWPGKELTLTMGDAITDSLNWTRATRFAGVQLGRDFSLQPYRVTTPLPQFMGNATLPSSVDLYINGLQRYTGSVPAGPFELNTPPRLTGLGNAQVVLTDAMGRSTQIDIPFYSSSRLLAKGLSDWSVSAGYVRENYGLSSFSYADDPMVDGTFRYGVNNYFTAGTHVAATSGLTLGGVGMVATLGLAGQLSGSYTVSQSHSQQGTQYSLGYQWQGPVFNFSARTIRSDSSYKDVAALYSSPPALTTDSAVAGLNLDKMGTLSLSYVQSRYPDSSSNRYAGAYWSKSIGDSMTLSASYTRNLTGTHDQMVFLGLTMYLGNNVDVGSTMQHANHQTTYGVSASQSTPSTTGWGWSMQGQRAPDTRYGNAQVDYRGQYGEYRAGVTASDSDNTIFAATSGSVVAMGGGLFAGQKIYDGFAVVSTDNVPDIPVSLQNNPVGKTNADGLLMVSPLGAYQNNLISINTMSLPANYRADRVDAKVATARDSGALVEFHINKVHAATLILRGTDGKPLPVGASVRLNGSKQVALIGYGGQTYLEKLKPENTVTVLVKDKTCSVTFAYHDSANIAKPIGPLVCE